MRKEFAIVEKYLNDWFSHHQGVYEKDLWYFRMILTLNGYDLFDTILCIYIHNAEKNNLNMNYDYVFNYILTRVGTRTLGNTILEWQNYVQETIAYYGDFYSDMIDAFTNYLKEYRKADDKTLLY